MVPCSGAKLEDWRGLPAACQSAICAPMLSNGMAIGCLSVTSSRPHAFSGCGTCPAGAAIALTPSAECVSLPCQVEVMINALVMGRASGSCTRRLQQTFSTLAAVIAPHLRLARSEKALQATQSLLRDALALEQANASAAHQQHQPLQRVQQTAAASADVAAEAPATPKAAHGAALRAVSMASTAADSFDVQPSAAPPAAATPAVTTAQSATAQPLVTRIVAAASTAAGWLRALATNSIRPPAPTSTASPAAEPGASGSKVGKGRFAGRRHRGEGYAFDDYAFSSDDDSAEPSRAAAMPAVAAPLGHWRGPLEFWDVAAEGAYLDWACGTWQVRSLLLLQQVTQILRHLPSVSCF